jgi:uncharacterized spore protein YtfJ
MNNELFLTAVKTPAEGMALLEKLTNVAQAEVVFSESVSNGPYTVITASEVTAGLGFGFGGGAAPAPAGSPESNTGSSGGGGGGGGGTVMARPVAAISIGPDGVRVEPIVDVTKVSLAFFTAFGGMMLMLNRMRRFGRQ